MRIEFNYKNLSVSFDVTEVPTEEQSKAISNDIKKALNGRTEINQTTFHNIVYMNAQKHISINPNPIVKAFHFD